MLSHIMENSEKINEFKEVKEYLALAVVLSYEGGMFFIFTFISNNIIFSIISGIIGWILVIASLFSGRKIKKLFLKYYK